MDAMQNNHNAIIGSQFASNVGSWMQTVGAQELTLTLTSSAR